jgi:hypothetical protein
LGGFAVGVEGVAGGVYEGHGVFELWRELEGYSGLACDRGMF